jgi:hypothetical protein
MTPIEDRLLNLLFEIRNCVRAASHGQVKLALEEALPDAKSRTAYQMFDGTVAADRVRKVCRMSPNAIVALSARCVSMGLMEVNVDNKRIRLFDLKDFGLMPVQAGKPGEGKSER